MSGVLLALLLPGLSWAAGDWQRLQDEGTAARDLAQAEEKYSAALAVAVKDSGEDSAQTALTTECLGTVYDQRAKYRQARAMLERSIAIQSRTHSPPNLFTMTMNNLATVYEHEGDLADAAKMNEKALALRERFFGKDSSQVAQSASNLADVYRNMERFDLATEFYRRAADIERKRRDPDPARLATLLNNLGEMISAMGHSRRAAQAYRDSLAFSRKAPDDRLGRAKTLNNLAAAEAALGEWPAAEGHYKEALALKRALLGPDHPSVALTLENYSDLLEKTGRSAEAASMAASARKIRSRQSR